MRKSFILAGLLASFTAPGSIAQAAEPQPDLSGPYTAHPPVPAQGADIAALTAWKDRYIATAGWRFGSIDKDRIILFDTDSIKRLPDGHISLWMRAELYRTVYRHDQGIRSLIKDLEIDCGNLRMRELHYVGFSSSNLQDVIRPGQPWNPEWTEPPVAGSGGAIANRLACDAAGVGVGK